MRRPGSPSSAIRRITNVDPAGRRAMKSLLRAVRLLLITAAVLLLTYSAFVFADAGIFERAKNAELNRGLNTAGLKRTALSLPVLPSDAGLIGRLEIPRLALSVIVMEGTSAKNLRRAAGHIIGTALPGEPGNIGVSAHRDTFFRPLRNISKNDSITFTTRKGEYRYRVLSTVIVSPDDVAVLAAGADDTLTLVTCYPFYFVGPAPKRFIVRAQRVI